MDMPIKRYRPQHEQRWKDAGDGSFRAEVYSDHGVVDVFTYRGDSRQRAFTCLKMYIAPNVYHVTLPRHYHQRWLRRLAYEFAFRCGQAAKMPTGHDDAAGA